MHRSFWIFPLLGLVTIIGCAAEPIEEPQATTQQAFSGRIPEMAEADRPAGVVDSWDQPDSEGAFEQYGYCGATAAANLLRWYGKDVSPRQAIDDGCWSYIGTRPATLAAYFRNHHAELGCALHTAPSAASAFASLSRNLSSGKPVVILFMTGRLNAHWVTATALQGSGDDAKVTVMSWGGYYTIRWADFWDAWRAGYSGPYPHITCEASSPLASGLRVE